VTVVLVNFGTSQFIKALCFLKVFIFVWRLLRDNLSIKINLVIWGIITPKSHFCVVGYGGIESAHHLFLTCNTFGSFWSLGRSWIGFLAVDSHNLSDIFLRFNYSSGGRKGQRSFLQLIWLLCVWLVWNERNRRLFRNSEQSLPQMLNKVKRYSLSVVEATNTTLISNYYRWWSYSLTCLSID
jgi:hypothetical protein